MGRGGEGRSVSAVGGQRLDTCGNAGVKQGRERGSKSCRAKQTEKESGRRQVAEAREAGSEGHGDDKWEEPKHY